ncbi:MAG: hypothetical protein IPL65_12140 [Lewinellaceae bacterium]|nr:hypothetical protein [Lewinellaceae bacterium]
MRRSFPAFFALTPSLLRLVFLLLTCCSAHLLLAQGKHDKEDVLTAKEAMEDALLAPDAYHPHPIDTTRGMAVIAFGSCNKIDKPQTMWEFVNENDPNLWIWLGDIIYADTTDMRALRGMYRQLKMDPGYSKLRHKAQIIGIYDDHDFGANDAGKGYP